MRRFLSFFSNRSTDLLILKVQINHYNKFFMQTPNISELVISYADLESGKDLTQVIQKAYGPRGLGILFVENIPDYPETRKAALTSIWELGSLPADKLKNYERPEIYHTRGWSKGAEQFEGQYDDAKGSFYVNCCTDDPLTIANQDLPLFSEHELKVNAGNVWVSDLPHLEKNIKQLSSLMIKTGALLAKQIDAAAEKNVNNYEKSHLTNIINEGTQHIGRMLHYFPFTKTGTGDGDWCGWHNDHGALTALTSAIYMDEDGNEVQIKSKEGGLYAKNRFAEMTRIPIPPNMLAFQLGEVTQIISGGHLEATPHCVLKSSEIAGKKISRETFALFMQPNALHKLDVPEGVNESEVTTNGAHKIPELKKRWKNGMFFKDFHNATIEHYS